MVGITKLEEQRRVPIHLHQGVPADVAGGNGQKAARVDLAGVGDEDEAFAIVDSTRAAESQRALEERGFPRWVALLSQMAGPALISNFMELQKSRSARIMKTARGRGRSLEASNANW